MGKYWLPINGFLVLNSIVVCKESLMLIFNLERSLKNLGEDCLITTEPLAIWSNSFQVKLSLSILY